MFYSLIDLLLLVGDEQVIVVAAGLARPHYLIIEMDVIPLLRTGVRGVWEVIRVTEHL